MRVIQNIFNSRSPEDGNFFNELNRLLGFKPKKISIYRKAFTHRSLNIKDEDGNALNYERLEFLGDAMLGAVIASHLYNEVPDEDEGYLTKMRSKIVSRQQLNQLGKDLNLIQFVKSNIPNDQFSINIYGNIFEALVGAIYLDRGYDYCTKFIHRQIITPYVNIEKLEGRIISYKSLLIEWCQKQKKEFSYEIYEDTGRNELKHFAVKLWISKKVVAKARATSKKKAEEKASKRAYYALQNKID